MRDAKRLLLRIIFTHGILVLEGRMEFTALIYRHCIRPN